MAEDMSVEQPRPTPTSRETQVAERWMRMKGVQRPEEPKPVSSGGLFGKVTEAFRRPAETSTLSNPNQLVGEAYDLFVEKQTLQEDITRKQREVMEPKSTATALTLEQKRDLIRQGRIGTILQSVSAAEPFGEVVAKSQARTKEVDTRLDEIFATPGMYDKFHEDLSRQVRVRHQAREVRSLDKFTEQADVLAVKLTREAQVQGRTLTSVERQFIDDNQALKKDAVLRRQDLLKDPEVFDRVRIMDLQEYQRQLQKDHFAETPSRNTYIRKIESYWAEGKKILLTGPTGTGKTELIYAASRKLFGVSPEYNTGGPDLNEYQVTGKTGLSGAGDIFRPGPWVRAWTNREGKGQPYLFDELDRAPNPILMTFKTLMNFRPGQKGVKVQTDSGTSFDVGRDYALAATANVKSEKHATATELDSAIKRMFAGNSIDIDYMPAAELYDLALASLIDKQGGIALSEVDARVTLKNLCDATSWIQDAYQGKQVMTDPSNGTVLEARGQATTAKAASIKDALLDPGTTIGMVNGWLVEQVKGISFEEYLNQRIKEFINNRTYPDEDRYYITEIFALKGFLRGSKAGDLMVAGLTQDTLDRWSGATSGRVAKTGAQTYLSADRVAKLDPYSRFKRPASADAEDLLAEDEEGEASDTESPPLVVSDRYKAVKDVVGDIISQDRPKTLHYAYINKLAELGSRATSAIEKKQVIAMLDEYARKGAYDQVEWQDTRAVDFTHSLREQAAQKAAEIRLSIINSSTDFGVIKNFAGDLTTTIGTKKLHHVYINRVFEIGFHASSTEVIRKAVELLEEYGKSGAYDQVEWQDTRAVDFAHSLREQAAQKAVEIRKKILSSI